VLGLLFESPGTAGPTPPGRVVVVAGIPLQPLPGVGGPGDRSLGDLVDPRRTGVFRRQPLRPGDRPLDVLAAMDAEDRWGRDPRYPPAYQRWFVVNQLLRLLDPVYPLPTSPNGSKLPLSKWLEERYGQITDEDLRQEERWNRTLAELA